MKKVAADFMPEVREMWLATRRGPSTPVRVQKALAHLILSSTTPSFLENAMQLCVAAFDLAAQSLQTLRAIEETEVHASRAILAEVDRQNHIWSEEQQNHSFDRWCSIAVEEVGELAEAFNTNGFEMNDHALEECVQVAAVALQIRARYPQDKPLPLAVALIV